MNRIKELRELKNIKQSDFARELNVSQGTLSNWERGVHDPDTDSLLKISEFFNISVDYILGKSEIPLPKSIDEIDIDYCALKLNWGIAYHMLDAIKSKISEFPDDRQSQKMKEWLVLVEHTIEKGNEAFADVKDLVAIKKMIHRKDSE